MRLLLTIVSIPVVACGGPPLPPPSVGPCFEPFRTDVPIEDCAVAEGDLFVLPGRTAEDRERAEALCSAPCIVVKGTLNIENPYESLKSLPVLSKIRQTPGGFVSFRGPEDRTRNLVGLPRFETGFESPLGRIDIYDKEDFSFEGVPDDAYDSVSVTSCEKLTLLGLERQSGLTRVEVKTSFLMSLAGLGKAPKLQNLSVYSDRGLKDLTGLGGNESRFALLIQASQINSLAGVGVGLNLGEIALRNNPNLSQCEAVAFAERLGLKTSGITSNGPCP